MRQPQEIQRSLKERDRANKFYIPELEGHRHPFLAAALPHLEVIIFLLMGLGGGVGAYLAGHVIAGGAVAAVSGLALLVIGWVRLIDPAKRKRP